MTKVSRLAPSAKAFRSHEDLLRELEERLKSDFSLPMLERFSVVFEGWTDVGYVELAVRLYQESNSEDLLEIPREIAGVDGARIGIFTPGIPGNPARGGVGQIVRLAELLKPYVFTLGAFQGLMFVFDHDKAGIEAAIKTTNNGYRLGVNVLTLDPNSKLDACAKKQICIEDLLPLDIQRQYFEKNATTCSVEYVDGVLERFSKWGDTSKPGLRDFVCDKATLDDVQEIVQLVIRVRRAFALPT